MRGSRRASGLLRRSAPGLLVALLIVLAVAAVALSPLAFRGLAGIDGVDWDRLSAIGETYGPTSALISVFAVAGVVGTILLQYREVRINRSDSARTFHHELLKMAMDDPKYFECWGPHQHATHERAQRSMYINLIISFWEMIYLAGDRSEGTLRANAHRLFPGAEGREYWRRFGAARMASAGGRAHHRFVRILDEQYRRLLADRPVAWRASLQAGAEPPPRGRDPRRAVVLAVLAGGAAGIVAGRAGRRR
ncbi:hypothetical protein B0I33_10147 [Prauserella shujinwangii]|uniref:Uncharacterized protein n=1 Tax=Prauserella shujinwangii TaxID=1453103 RepID=A0A2T0M2E7_9PSEU|nr:DUF6082 family protein [Prauserella shujinwangii]PRX50896.1 hypothetical protein B0I33_10147 [Prauserella shujinwangii]